MSGLMRPGHFLGKILSNSEGKVTLEAAPEDVEYLNVGQTYDFDATPVGSDSSGQEDPGPQSGN